ncbi:MAG: GAF domain-containing sensor histidine kinase [Terriglobia bacterium]
MNERGVRTERIIAGARLVLAIGAIGLVMLYPNPADPESGSAYSVVVLYFLYSFAVVWIVDRNLMRVDRLGFVTQVVDTLWFPAILLRTQGENSPFFLYYVFSLITASFRWGFRETLFVNTANVGMYVIVHFATVQTGFSFNRFWVRPTYLYVLACLIGYLGEHQRRVQRQLISLAELSGSILVKASFPRMLEASMEQVRRLFRVEQCILVLEDGDSRRISLRKVGISVGKSFYQMGGLPSRKMEFLMSPRQNWGYFINPHNRVVTLLGVKETFVYDFESQKPVSHAFQPNLLLANLFEMRSMLSVPVYVGGAYVGRVYLVNRMEGIFSSSDLQYLKLLVSQLAPLLDNYRLLQRMQKISVLEEKNRIARDLHDGLVQALASLDIRLAVCRKLLLESSSKLSYELEELQRIVQDEYTELRNYMRRLRTPSFEGQELEKAIRNYALAFQRENNFKVRVEVPISPLHLPRQINRELYQIFHEALTNVRKHSGAKHVLVELIQNDTSFSLVVSDDGQGVLPPSDETPSGKKIPWSISERAAALRGSTSLDSAPGQGCRLTISIPIHDPHPQIENDHVPSSKETATVE